MSYCKRWPRVKSQVRKQSSRSMESSAHVCFSSVSAEKSVECAARLLPSSGAASSNPGEPFRHLGRCTATERVAALPARVTGERARSPLGQLSSLEAEQVHRGLVIELAGNLRLPKSISSLSRPRRHVPQMSQPPPPPMTSPRRAMRHVRNSIPKREAAWDAARANGPGMYLE